MLCPGCGQDNPSRAKFCLECGQRLPSACPACGHPVPDNAKFCMECGAPLGAPALVHAPESYTPRHLAEKILASRAALEGERKAVTVLFCDVVGSTNLAERLGAEGMHALLNRLFDMALAEVHRFEGTINQFLGDGFMALFGAPVAHEDHARRAVLAALGIQKSIGARPIEVEDGPAISLQLRVGVHTGFVVVGAIGDNLRMDYTAVGDTTHLAARLQQQAAPGTIVVSEATARLVRGYVELEPQGHAEIRGLSAPVPIYRATGAGSRRSPLEIDERSLSRFVGRGRELEALRDLLTEAQEGHGQVIGLVGEPGVGKSRLLFELRRILYEQGVTYIEGRCLSFGGAIPYLPMLDVVRGACGVVDADLPESVADKVRTALASVAMDSHSAAALLHALGVKAGPEESIDGLAPEIIKARTFEAVRQLLFRMSRRTAMLLAIEDLHWIDRSSEELLGTLVDGLAGAPIMVVATYRPGYRPGWLDKSYATQISLGHLARADSRAVVHSVLRDAGDAVTQVILDKAEGNPFFLEELARALGDDAAGSGELRVPDTVHGVLTARIDRLSDGSKRLLQTAAIVGRAFSLPLLSAVWGSAASPAQLDELTRHEFIYERSGSDEPTYVFKHALTQDVAESTILAPRRRELHQRAADGLVALYPDRRRELAPILAHHYFEAAAWPLACEHATRAAEAAAAAYANREALARYDQALVAAARGVVSDGERMRLHAARGTVHAVLGAFDPARADLEIALAVAETANDTRARATFLSALAALWGGHKDYARGGELARSAVRVAEESDDRRVLAEALVQLGLMHVNAARMRESSEVLERALAIFRDLDDDRGLAETLDVLAMVVGIRGHADMAIRYGDEALQRFRALGDRTREPSLLTNNGFWRLYAGDPAGAEPFQHEGLRAAIELGARAAEAYARTSIAWTHDFVGEYAQALREAETGHAIAREIGHVEWTVAALSILGRVHTACGDPSGGRALHEEMLALARELTGLWMSSALCMLGEDLFRLGDEATALRHIEEGMAAAGDATEFSVAGLLTRVEIHLARGEAREALRLARHVQTMAPEYRVHLLDARRLEGEACASLGDLDEGIALLEEAKRGSHAKGVAPSRWKSAVALAEIFRRRGRADDAARESAEARTILEHAARDLPEALRRSLLAQASREA
jgi:class 3 adenylate cyclase/tetratricopeptide (TPR) repeat protein